MMEDIGHIIFKDGSLEFIESARMDQDVLIVTTEHSTYMYKKKEKKFYTYNTMIYLYGDNKPLFAVPDWIMNDKIFQITMYGQAFFGGDDSE